MLELLQYRAWALSEAYFNHMYPVVANAIRLGHNLIKKKSQEDFIPTIEGMLSMPEVEGHPMGADVEVEFKIERDPQSGLPTVRSGGSRIALISVVGPLTKYGDLCELGMQDYQRIINRANSSEGIDGMVMIMDSPGGTVDGTQEFGLTVKNSKKPIGVFGDNHVASAALWIASQAAVIVGNKNNPTEFGSIGVLMVDQDWNNVMDAGFIPKMTIIRAPGSEEKALLNPLEATTAETLATVRADMKVIRDMFVSTVKAGRGAKLDTSTEGLFSGRMFDVYKSKQAGLIDAIGTLQTAVNKVAEISRQRKKEQGTSGATSPNANTTMKFKSNLLSKLFGQSEKAEEPNAAAEQTSAIDEKVVELEAENAKLKQEKEAAEQKAAQLEATVSEQKTQITNLETKVAEQKAELDKQPTGQKTTVITNEGKEGKQAADPKEAEKANKFRTSADDEADKYVNATTLKVK